MTRVRKWTYLIDRLLLDLVLCLKEKCGAHASRAALCITIGRVSAYCHGWRIAKTQQTKLATLLINAARMPTGWLKIML